MCRIMRVKSSPTTCLYNQPSGGASAQRAERQIMDSETVILAIDPGKSGGMAMRNASTHEAFKMPDTDGDIVDRLRSLSAQYKTRVCYIEKVGGFVRGNKTPGSAMFNFGHGRGVIMGALMAFGWRIIEVPPVRWQKWLGIGTCGGDKRKLKAEAQRRFPNDRVTLMTADVLLILDYARAMEAAAKGGVE